MADFTDNLEPARPSGPEALAKERSSSTVPVKELSSHLFANSDFLERQERVLKDIVKEKLFSKSTQLNLSRPERYQLGLARAKLLRRMADRLGWDLEDVRIIPRGRLFSLFLTNVNVRQVYASNYAWISPLMLSIVTTVKEQGSEEQRAHWLPLINRWQIYGAYAQTELGHGSNVKGLELQARYDASTEEFVLHSPTLTASKWWNGSLGRTATHAIVVAQLMLPRSAQENLQLPGVKSNKCGSTGGNELISLGPHPFIVQVRDLKTHKPLPGIAVGDIGVKYGYAPMDNGYMLFDKHHVPHSAFLARYFQVDKSTGRYTSLKKDQPVVYGSLTNVRVNIVMQARLVLARAVTVAMRYLTIRKQFQDRDSRGGASPEMTVLDYPTVQIRVLPLLATTYALHYTGIAMGRQYAETRHGIENNDFSALSDLHATSSGLKSLCTTYAADGIETCRRALGGHGFGGGSGLIQLNADYLSKPTVEGDNWMITQQTASYLIKKTEKVAQGGRYPEPGPGDQITTALKNYLDRNRSRSSADNLNLNVIGSDVAVVEAFEMRAAHLSYQAYTLRVKQKRSWNSLLIQLHHLSNAFSQLLLVRNFYNALRPSSASPPSSDAQIPSAAHPVMVICFRLFSLHAMSQNARDFSASGAVSDSTLDALPDQILSLMSELRPHVVKLADAWAIPDYLLDSALGRYDGRIYEDLFNRAHRLNPLNKTTFNPYYWDESIIMGEKDSGKEILSKL